MLTARATTSTPMTRDTAASVIIISLARRLIAEMSVGLNAVTKAPRPAGGAPAGPDALVAR